MFTAKSFIVFDLIFRSLIHFEFIFVYHIRECSNRNSTEFLTLILHPTTLLNLLMRSNSFLVAYI